MTSSVGRVTVAKGSAVTIRANVFFPVYPWREPEALFLSATTSPRFSTVPSGVTAHRT